MSTAELAKGIEKVLASGCCSDSCRAETTIVCTSGVVKDEKKHTELIPEISRAGGVPISSNLEKVFMANSTLSIHFTDF